MQTTQQDMPTLVNEPIVVGVVFAQGRIRPAWFIWRGRRYGQCQVTMQWHAREGATDFLYMSVTDGSGNSYELVLNQQRLSWRLAAVAGPDGAW